MLVLDTLLGDDILHFCRVADQVRAGAEGDLRRLVQSLEAVLVLYAAATCDS